MVRSLRTLSLALLLFVSAAIAPVAGLAGEVASAEFIPGGSVAVIHVDTPALLASPKMSFLMELAGRVAPEASRFSLARLGVDATTLSDATLVFPDMATYMQASAAKTPPFVALLTFADGVRAEQLTAALRSEFGLQPADNGVLSNGDDFAILVGSDHMVVFGTPLTVEWWLAAREEQGPSKLANVLTDSADRGSVIAGLDLSQAPPLFLSLAPPQVQAVVQADLAVVSLDLEDKLTINLGLHYADDGEAAAAALNVEHLVAQGHTLLSAAEATAQGTINDAQSSLSDGAASLAALAMTRQGKEYLNGVQVAQQGSTLSVAAAVDNEITSTVMICLTAIQQIGQNANAQFESVADEISQR